MELNLPIYEHLQDAKNVLIAGMGGGFDVFCGLPLFFALRERGFNVHLANYSFSAIIDLVRKKQGQILTDTLVGISAEVEGLYVYAPELYLSQWFKQVRGEDVTIWSFYKTGARVLLEDYRVLVEHLGIDAIILIDGGVDSLMRGDEAQVGTLLEDTVSLISVDALKGISTRLIACLGFGAEQDMAYAHVMENIAALTKLKAFLGTCSLLPQMDVYQQYEQAVLYVQDKPYQSPSVINSSVISAARGQYGNYHLTEKTRGSQLWISPLMGIYWFFELPAVARRNLLADMLRYTEDSNDLFRVALASINTIAKRKNGNIPL